jgi:[ribosomal protein S18]-alanine N-acetyltransferase
VPEDKGVGVTGEARSVREVSLRPFVVSDLPAVLEIEQASFPVPWKPEFFFSEMNTPYARLVVAERAGQVIGYFCCWLVADEVHILDVAVHPGHRRRGVGRLLLQYILAEARQNGVRSASLEVRVSNQPAIALYQALGFQQVAIRRQYYENGEDAFLMVCSLSGLTAK